MQNFDQATWERLMSGARGHAAAAPAIRSVRDTGENDLDLSMDFSALKRMDRRAKIAKTHTGYRIETSTSKVAFSLPFLLSTGNQVELQFAEEMAYYTPDPELIKKSAVPLWVLRPVGDRTVVLERVW